MGSNPIARSKFPFDLNALLADGPEEGFVHWRATGANLLEQNIDGADGVPQIRRIERGIDLGRTAPGSRERGVVLASLESVRRALAARLPGALDRSGSWLTA